MKKQIIFSIFFVLIVVSMFGVVRSEMLTSSANVSYDSKIVEQLQNQSEVDIFFEVDNSSNANNLFVNLSKDTQNFKDLEKSPYEPRIAVITTQNGFNQLLNDSRIKNIYFAAPVYIANTCNNNGVCDNSENCTSCTFDCGLCNIKQNNIISNLWFWIIIIVVILITIFGLYFLLKKKK